MLSGGSAGQKRNQLGDTAAGSARDGQCRHGQQPNRERQGKGQTTLGRQRRRYTTTGRGGGGRQKTQFAQTRRWRHPRERHRHSRRNTGGYCFLVVAWTCAGLCSFCFLASLSFSEPPVTLRVDLFRSSVSSLFATGGGRRRTSAPEVFH